MGVLGRLPGGGDSWLCSVMWVGVYQGKGAEEWGLLVWMSKEFGSKGKNPSQWEDRDEGEGHRGWAGGGTGEAGKAGPERCVTDLGPSHRGAMHVFTWVCAYWATCWLTGVSHVHPSLEDFGIHIDFYLLYLFVHFFLYFKEMLSNLPSDEKLLKYSKMFP